MLSGSTLDLDTFAEIVSFVESVDTVNDGLVSDLTSVTGASIDSLETQVSGLSGGSEASIDSLETLVGVVQSDVDQNELDADASIDSLETLAGAAAVKVDVDASIDSLETLAGLIQSDVDQNELDADASIDSLETALGNEISATNTDVTDLSASIDSLEGAAAVKVDVDASIDSLEQMVTYSEQGASVTGPDTFMVGTPIAFSAQDDLLVFINGHNIHRTSSVEGLSEGYETLDGQNFNLINIGYNIDVTDHVVVMAHRV